MPNICQYDQARLWALLPIQYGVVARWQALECGLTPRAIDYRLRRGGPWRAMLPGVYLTMTGTPTQEQREIAALLYAGSGSVITGAVAVRRHRLTCAGLNLIDVLIPADEQRASTGFVRIQRTTRMPDKVHETGGIRFAPAHRAVADAARKMTSFGDVQAVVCAALQRKRCVLPLLIEELNDGPSAGSRSLRRALAEVSDGVRSTAEVGLKRLIDHSDLEKPLYNARLYTPDGDFIAKPDAWWQRAGVAGEVDSREYHMEAADYRATQMRHNRMESYGINVQHWLPSVIATESRTVLSDLRRAIAAGHARPLLSVVTMVDG
jgi:hypothetical protein